MSHSLSINHSSRLSYSRRTPFFILAFTSQVHHDVKFAKADVEKLPFFVQKLGVRMLPCVVLFIDGKAVDRIIGCVCRSEFLFLVDHNSQNHVFIFTLLPALMISAARTISRLAFSSSACGWLALCPMALANV
jgi:hypothetical protein